MVWRDALDMLAERRRAGAPVEGATFDAVVSCCLRSGEFRRAGRLFMQAAELGLITSATTADELVLAVESDRCRRLPEVLDQLSATRDAAASAAVAAGVALLEAASRGGHCEVATALFDDLAAAGRPPVVAFGALHEAGHGHPGVDGLLAALADAGLEPDAGVFHAAMRRACAGDDGLEPTVERARGVLGAMRGAGLQPERPLYELLLEVHQRHRDWHGALDVYNEMRELGWRFTERGYWTERPLAPLDVAVDESFPPAADVEPLVASGALG